MIFKVPFNQSILGFSDTPWTWGRLGFAAVAEGTEGGCDLMQPLQLLKGKTGILHTTKGRNKYAQCFLTWQKIVKIRPCKEERQGN